MSRSSDAYSHHPELRGLIKDPLESFFRDFNAFEYLSKKPELAWAMHVMHSDHDREASRMRALADRKDGDLWVFAYGSLMWDPALRFEEVRKARAPHHARRFILKDIWGGRGTREKPGLMAALDTGDGCEGLAYRIAQQNIDEETEILWRREMIGPGYTPTFVRLDAGDKRLQALTFVANHEREAMQAGLTRAEQVELLATGVGEIGTSADYLRNIVRQFAALGIVDEYCSALLDEVEMHISAHSFKTVGSAR